MDSLDRKRDYISERFVRTEGFYQNGRSTRRELFGTLTLSHSA